MKIIQQMKRYDVIVVGGGLAACLAAIRSKQGLGTQGKVALIDKSYAGYSGQTPFAAGVFLAYDPDQHEIEEWLLEIIRAGDFLNDQAWCKKTLEKSLEAAHFLNQCAADKGLEVFRKNSDGSFFRNQSRGHQKTNHLIGSFSSIMKVLRKVAQAIGVEIFDRVMITDILVENGLPSGLLGLAYRERKLYLFNAGVYILAASGSGFKSVYQGHQALTGDLQAAALEAGIVLRNLEQYYANTTSRYLDIHGLTLFVSLGGRFINRAGDQFMKNYSALGNRAGLTDLVIAFCQEAEEGREPIYLDLRGVSTPDRDLCRELLPTVFTMWDRAGVDPFSYPMDWIPAPYPTLASGGGIHVGLFAETNLPGVYGAGDITCLPPHGTYSVGGLNLSFAAVSGLVAGEQSTVVDKLNNKPSITLAVEKAKKILQPLDRPEAMPVSQVVANIQNLVIPYHVGYLKSADTLKKAWAEAERIEKVDVDRLSARDGHTLMRAVECRSMIRLAQAMIKASLFRTESRGFHFRKDFPFIDNVNWLKWVLVQRDHNITEAGGLILSTCDVPLPYYRPDTARQREIT